jgi:hypothetical protein
MKKGLSDPSSSASSQTSSSDTSEIERLRNTGLILFILYNINVVTPLSIIQMRTNIHRACRGQMPFFRRAEFDVVTIY